MLHVQIFKAHILGNLFLFIFIFQVTCIQLNLKYFCKIIYYIFLYSITYINLDFKFNYLVKHTISVSTSE